MMTVDCFEQEEQILVCYIYIYIVHISIIKIKEIEIFKSIYNIHNSNDGNFFEVADNSSLRWNDI